MCECVCVFVKYIFIKIPEYFLRDGSTHEIAKVRKYDSYTKINRINIRSPGVKTNILKNLAIGNGLAVVKYSVFTISLYICARNP